MIKNGVGGSNTNKNGLKFESRTDIKSLLEKSGWNLLDTNIHPLIKKIDHDCKDIFILEKQRLYIYLKSVIENFDSKNYISKELWPDNAIINLTDKKLKIIEVKFQETSGSVDEKIQTCDFKKKQYEKLSLPLGYSVEYIYILNDWFKKEEYKDVLNYIKETGSCYFFNKIPIEKIFS